MIHLKNTEIDETQTANNLILVNNKIIDETGTKINFSGYREIVEFSTSQTLTVDDCKSKLYKFTGSAISTLTLPDITQTGLNVDLYTGDHSIHLQCHSSDTISGNSMLYQLSEKSYYSIISLTASSWYFEKKENSPYGIFDEEMNLTTKINLSMDYSFSNSLSDVLWAWGDNQYGQLGDNTTTSKSTPVQVCGGHTFCKVSGGLYTGYGLKSNGELWSWGFSNYGNLGDNTTLIKSTPIQVCGGHTFCDIVCGLNHVTALDNNNNLWSWGQNDSGECGINKSGSNILTPTRIFF